MSGRIVRFCLGIIAALGVLPHVAHAQGFDFQPADFTETGELQVSIEDGAQAGSHFHRFDLIVTRGGIRSGYQLLFSDPSIAEKIPSGTIARVTGFRATSPLGGEVVSVEEFEPLLAHAFSSQSYTGARTALPVRVVFSDGAPTATSADIAGFMWDGTRNINGWFQEASHGVTSFPRQTNGSGQARVEEVSISGSRSGCDPVGWANSVDAVLQSRGVSVSSFQHILYFLPETGCGWAGLGNVGCFGTCRAWTNNYGSPNTTTADVMFHELGHNISLNHARTDATNSGTTQCEYCDEGSAMGYGGIGYRGFNAHSMGQLGWLPSARIVSSSSSATYQVFPMEVNTLTVSPTPSPSAVQLIRVPYPGDSTRFYLLSYRKRSGTYDVNLSGDFHEKVSIHWGTLSDTYTYLITSLGAGQTYTSGALSFTFLSANSTSAQVQVTNGAPPTATPTATPTFTPTTAPTASPTPPTQPTATPSPIPTFAPTVAPTSTPSGGGPTPQPTQNPIGTPNPLPPDDEGEDGEEVETGIAALRVAGARGFSTALVAGEDGVLRVTLRNGKANVILPVGEHAVFHRRGTRGRFSFLGNIEVVSSLTTPQLFRFRAR